MKEATVIATNRFGLGARPGDFDIVDRNPQAWLLDQLQGPSRTPGDIRELPHSSTVLTDVQALRREERQRKKSPDNDNPDVTSVEKYGQVARGHFMDQVAARYRTATASDYPFYERLVHFWSNHFAISADQQPLPTITGLFENEAIRPHVAGKFADMLIAAEQHPAMILFLDNQRSIGPNSQFGKRANRRNKDRTIGLNENLAREILELHTLGVNGGYTQEDVTTFAKVITGWSIGGTNENGRFAEGEPGTFEFRESFHEPGKKTILGKSYRQREVDQGEAVLRDLAVHPSTAKFLATKLARHFVADEPPAELVGKLSATYLESDGDLSVVYQALVQADEPWREIHAKYKTPHEFVVSTFRAFNRVPDDARFIVRALELMGQTTFRPGSPEGWPDTAEQWGGADGLYKRIEWCNTVARVVGSKARPVELGDAVLGPGMSMTTRKSIARAENGVQGLTLLLASPEFQRR
ncbi:MAG: DUF1800 domain-containing protein [Gammaproteobacteria bacterium]|jgi:uncharacterized protein (DUF1800 family)|nr:DUF1800 domain-containing protein [Gammaproteobacteria bacterium]